jgi:acyl-CoA synthetase (AMP-forming)/AMP-acid ligase II
MTRRRRNQPLTLADLTAPERAPPTPPLAGWPAKQAATRQVEALNVAAYVRHAAARMPDHPAVMAMGLGEPVQATRTLSFEALAREVDRLAHGLVAAGLRRGERVALALPLGVDLVVAACAVLQVGGVVALIDRRVRGEGRLRQCLAAARPAALVATPRVLATRMLTRRGAASPRLCIAAGAWLPAFLPGGCRSLAQVAGEKWRPFELADTGPTDEALVQLTNPATGPPRAVALDHATVVAQVESWRAALGFQEGEAALVVSPAAALLAVALGVTAVVPASLDVEALAAAATLPGLGTLVGPPRLMQALADRLRATGRVLSGPRRVVMAGAPAAPESHEAWRTVIPDGETHAVLATAEAQPLALVRGTEALEETRVMTDRGAGACLGPPLPHVEVALVRPGLEGGEAMAPELLVRTGEVGEIAVRGRIVSSRALCPATALSGPGGWWHRTGDLAWLDRRGRLWSCGRADDRIRVRGGDLYPSCAEAVFLRHARVRRAAVVPVGRGDVREPVLVVEPHPGQEPKDDADRVRVQAELLYLAQQEDLTRGVRRVLFHERLPTDAAGCGKLARPEVARWAASQLPDTRG